MSERTTFVQLFVGLILFVTGVHASCPIELSPPSVVVRYGDPVSVNCSTSESLYEGIGWEASQGGTGLEKVNVLPWTVANLTEWNSSPSCFFTSYDSTEQCIKNLTLVIYTFPETISFRSSSDSSGVMKEGQEYIFTCDIGKVAPVQNVTVRWYKEDTIIRTDSFDNTAKQPVDQSPDFRFTPTGQDNGATFRCEAYLDLGPEGPQINVSSKEYTITVLFGPDLPCTAVELREGETLDEKCPVTGNPIPKIRWLKGGEPINSSVPLRRENAGMYVVEAEGSSFRKDVQVLILYGPELMCPNTFTVLEYMPHYPKCAVEGYPRPQTIWYKDGEEMDLPWRPTRWDAGQYLITASNDALSTNATVDLIVHYPPSEILELEDSEVDLGSTLWLKCSAIGNPRPKYSWDYFQTPNVMVENEDGVSHLTIHNATAYNMGNYSCLAWNDVGNVSTTVRITVKGVKQECPIVITPDKLVKQYHSTLAVAKCMSTSTNVSDLQEIFWQFSLGTIMTKRHLEFWFPDTHNGWNERPVCIAKFKGLGTCHKYLNFILFKTPDDVSIRRVDNSSLVVENEELQLQCDIINVAPAQSLTVRWYRGNETIEPGLLQLTDCQPDNNTDCNISTIRTPVNVSSTINITLTRKHHRAEFRCEAHLDLGPEGPQPPPSMMSSPLNLTIFYKPIINTTKLPKTVPVFRGYPEELICEADGHPPPKIQWLYSSNKVSHGSEGKLTVYEAGLYNCTATNDVNSTLHVVEVILKEDYLPLIAGFVAVTVVAISIVFLFIYSIYYKNTKMRRYNLKKPNFSTHNGNVAHNGWDLPLPMTKLS